MNTPLLLNRVIDAEIPCGAVTLEGNLLIPDQPRGLIVFAHGSGCSRHSARNRLAAQTMRDHRYATLVFDLLTEAEVEADARLGTLRKDIGLMASRLVAAVRWARWQPELRGLPIGLHGSATGAAVVLTASAALPEVRAIVSRGGRPELAGEQLHEVLSPTLLIAGGNDGPVLRRNRETLGRLPGVARMGVVSGATHLFEERGKLEEACGMAAEWFARHLRV